MEPKQKEYVCEGPVVKVHDAPSANVLPTHGVCQARLSYDNAVPRNT